MSPISKDVLMSMYTAATHPFDRRNIAVSIVKTILHFFPSLLHHPRFVANE